MPHQQVTKVLLSTTHSYDHSITLAKDRHRRTQKMEMTHSLSARPACISSLATTSDVCTRARAVRGSCRRRMNVIWNVAERRDLSRVAEERCPRRADVPCRPAVERRPPQTDLTSTPSTDSLRRRHTRPRWGSRPPVPRHPGRTSGWCHRAK